MILIKNGNIITMSDLNYPSGDLLIENGKIAEITEHIDSNLYPNATLIDASGYYVLPGLIESHCHIGITEEKCGQECDDCNEATNPITPHMDATDAINPMDAAFHDAIRAGITSVMVGPGSTNVVGGQFIFMKTAGSRDIRDLIVLAPAAIKVSFGENPKVCYGDKNQMPATRMGIAALLKEELLNAKIYMAQKKKAIEQNEAFTPNYKLEPWIPVFEKKIPLKAHVHRADDILTAIRIAQQFNVNITLDHCSEGHLIADEIKNSGFPAIVGPSLASRNKTEIKNVGFKTPGVLNKSGVIVALTTDHPVTLIQSLPICAGFAVKHGLPLEEGLKTITINAAKICNVDPFVGSLEVGKDGDVAIFDGNPIQTLTKCIYTIINGNIVFDSHQLNE